jgi:hypothetical protein
MGTISPIRDWRIDIAGKPYGVVQWNEGTCQVYTGKFIGHLPVSPPTVAFGVVVATFVLVFFLVHVRGRKQEKT